jgi:CDP-diacylglycerol--glycerol-3-phosphate 3-phosphatidyltransferase
VALRVPPSALTLLGVVLAGLAALAAHGGGTWLYAAFALVVGSGLLDSLDGAVALLSGRTSAVGYVLDSAADRIADAAYVVALLLAGAPAWVCATGALLAFLLEYVRARAALAGLPDVGVVTVWERPSRVIVTAMFLLGAAVYHGWSATAAATWTSLGAWVWVGLGVVGLLQLSVVVGRRLHGATPPG